MPEEGTRAHDVLLAVVDHLREVGRVDLSLRELAAAAGTSHRMLAYYFGTRERLLGLVMLRLSDEYRAHFAGRRPTTRVETLEAAWSRFRDPNNRLQTQLLFVLASAAAEDPDVDIPALNHDLDLFAGALTHFGVAEALAPEVAAREARLIVSTLLGLYLDDFISRGSERVDDSFAALVDWVGRSSAAASSGA